MKSLILTGLLSFATAPGPRRHRPVARFRSEGSCRASISC